MRREVAPGYCTPSRSDACRPTSRCRSCLTDRFRLLPRARPHAGSRSLCRVLRVGAGGRPSSSTGGGKAMMCCSLSTPVTLVAVRAASHIISVPGACHREVDFNQQFRHRHAPWCAELSIW